MMPTIRIEDDVFQGLQAIAVPFTDTPSSVIRRLLEERGVLPTPATHKTVPHESARTVEGEKSRSSSLTPQPIYETFLLHVLATMFSGRGEKHEVTKAVIDMMTSRGFIGPAELERVSTGETKAENTVAWGRNALKERGFISRLSPRGTWELTPQGIEEAKHINLPRKSG